MPDCVCRWDIILLVSTPVPLFQPWCPTSICAPAVSQQPAAYIPIGQITSLGGPSVAKRALLVLQLPLSHFRHLQFKKPLINILLCSDHLPLLGPTLQDYPIAHQIGSTAPVIGPTVPVVTSLLQPSGQNHILTLLRKKVPFVVLPQLLEINTHIAHSKFSIHPEMKLEHADENKVSWRATAHHRSLTIM